MLIYRFLSGEDDSAFCHKVTKALSEGWVLHGSASYAYDAMNKKMVCGQAVTKVVSEQPYDPGKKLVDTFRSFDLPRLGPGKPDPR